MNVTLDGNLCLNTVPPCRIYDSRVSGGTLAAAVERAIPIAGPCGIPAAAQAVVLNLTVVGDRLRDAKA